MWEKIKSYFRNRKMRSLLLEGRNVPRDFISLQKAKSLGLVININVCGTEDLKDIHRYIDSFQTKGVTVFLIELNYLKKSTPAFSTSAHSVFINPEKINWYDSPQPQVFQQIRQHPVDILINFDTSPFPVSHLICAAAIAKTRVGVYDEARQSSYELMVDFKEKRFKDMVPKFEHFLKMCDKSPQNVAR